MQGGQSYIEDLNSVNFTFVNQHKLTPNQPQALNDGDEIRLGRVKVIFRAG
jgi:pSer/pThr/pTyr-binding forkhead associated (FHA) protein